MNLQTVIDQYLNTLIVEKGLSKKTLESYRHDLTVFTLSFSPPKQVIADLQGVEIRLP